jgi:hypothetical protein
MLMTRRRIERKRTLASTAQVDELETTIIASVLKAIECVSAILTQENGVGSLAKLKFDKVGRDPLDKDRMLNFVEQLNQTFTYLATLRGVKYLLKRHPKAAPFIVNLGTASGPDIVSMDGSIMAEVFAATSPQSNKKLKKDVERVSKTAADHKYVFYYSPIAHKQEPVGNGVNIVRLPTVF